MHEPNSSALATYQKPPTPQKWRSLAGLLAVVATAAGIYLAFANRSTTSKSDFPLGAHYLPDNTLATVTLTTDRQRWQQLQQLGTPQSRAIVTQEFSKWQNEFLTGRGLDWEKDIQPLLGSEIQLAYLATSGQPAANNPSPKSPLSSPIALLPMTSELAATQFFAKTTASNGAASQTKERLYQGVTLRETTHQRKTLVTAIVDRIALVSPSATAIEKSIDAFKSGRTLAKLPGYRQAWPAIAMDQPLAQVYVNIPLAVASNASIVPPATLANLQQQQGLAVNINLENNLLTGKGLSWWQPQGQTNLTISKNSSDFGQRLPDSTVMMFSGSSLTQLWKDYLPLANQNPAAPVAPAAVVNGLKSLTGLSLENDILAWSNQDFLLALVPASQPRPNTLGGSLLMMLKPTDRAAAEATFNKLDQVMASRYQFQIAPTNTNGTDVVNWSSPIGGVNASHGWLSNELAFLALGTPITEQFLPQPVPPLANNKQFQQVMKSEISPYSGQFFMNLEKMQQSHQALLPQLTPTAQAIMSGIQAIGLTSNASSNITNRFDISILLKQVAGDTLSSPASSSISSPATPANQSSSF